LNNVFVLPTSDGRILFVVPWQGHYISGTTEDSNIHDLDNLILKKNDYDFIIKTLSD